MVASGEQPPEDGTIKRVVHPEEIRTKMLEEAEEVLKRYDVLVGPTDRMYVFSTLRPFPSSAHACWFDPVAHPTGSKNA